MNVGASRYPARACNFRFADLTFFFLHKLLLNSRLDNGPEVSHRRSVTLTAQRNCPRQRRMGQLLGIAQRTVEAFLPDFKQRFSARKLIPTEVKTLGDYLLLKRIKTDLSQPELALKTGFTVHKIKSWEHDQAILTEAEWRVLATVIGLEDAMRPDASKR